jgi:hypothetical protein
MDILGINYYISRYSTHQISYVKTITGCKTHRGSNIIAIVCTVEVYTSVQCIVLMKSRTQPMEDSETFGTALEMPRDAG